MLCQHFEIGGIRHLLGMTLTITSVNSDCFQLWESDCHGSTHVTVAMNAIIETEACVAYAGNYCKGFIYVVEFKKAHIYRAFYILY